MLAEELNAKSLRTRKRTFTSRDGSKREVGGLRFRSDWLRALICNPIYRGAIRYNGKEYPGQHEALVTVDEWETANAAVSEALKPALCQSTSVGHDRHFTLLKGIAVCGSCNRALVPQASGKLDHDGRPYRYYTCSAVLRERTDSTCRLRRVSALGLERSVVGLLGQLSMHPNVVEAVLAAGRKGNPGKIAELTRRLAVLGGEIDRVTKRMQNLFDTLEEGGLEAIDDDLREQAVELKSRKGSLLIERTQSQQALAGLQQAQLAPEKICAALECFDRLWDAIPPEEKREIATLLIARIEVDPVAGPASPSKSGERALKLRITLHLPALLGTGATPLTASKKKVVAIDAAVLLPGSTGELMIIRPFKYREAIRGKVVRTERKPLKRERPLQRALRWKEKLTLNPALTARALSKLVRVSETTMSMTLHLLRLIKPIQDSVLSNLDKPYAYHLGLRTLAALTDQPVEKQEAKFAELLTHWQSVSPRK